MERMIQGDRYEKRKKVPVPFSYQSQNILTKNSIGACPFCLVPFGCGKLEKTTKLNHISDTEKSQSSVTLKSMY